MSANPIKRLAGETAIYGLGTIIPRLLNYFLVPFYTRIFAQGEYGQITELYAWVAIIMVILTYGMETAFFRYAELEKDGKKVFNTATASLLFTSIVFLLMVFLFTGSIAGAMQYDGHNEYILILASIVAIDALTSIPFAYLRYTNKAVRFSTIKVASVLVNIALNLLFLLLIPKFAGDSLSGLFIYRNTELIAFVFIANLIASMVSLLLLGPELRQFKISIDKVLLKKMLAYGAPILVIGMAGMINEVSDKILLRYFLPDESTAQAQIGIYGANYKLAILMMLFIQMFRYAAEPFFFRESGKKDAKETYSKVMTWFVVFTWFIFLGVTLYIDIFKYFIGPAYWEGLAVVPIVLSAKLFLGIFYNLSVWYKLTNKTLYGALIALMGAAITIIMNIVLIPRIGYMGSAWANFACYFLMMIISYLWGRRIYKVSYNIRKILLYTALAAALFFISILPGFRGEAFHLTLNSALMLVYLMTVYFFEKKTFIKTGG
jgi:O-antigen/teichoic acid export membrane protein